MVAATDKKAVLVVLDLENIRVSAKKELGLRLDLELLDGWMHGSYKPVDKVAFLDCARANGERFKLYNLGWTIKDVVTKFQDYAEAVPMSVTVKNAVDYELALYIVEYVIESQVRTVLLMGGDGDYVRIVKLLKKWGVEVHVLAVNAALARRLENLADEVHHYEDLVNGAKGEDIKSHTVMMV